jgi:chromosome segregation protein
LESLTQEVNSINVERTSLKGKKENILLDVQRLESNMKLTENRVEQKENEKREHENKKSELMLEIQKSETAVDQLIIEKNVLEKKVVEIGEELEEKLQELKDLQNRSKTSQIEQEEVSEEVNRFEVNRAEITKDLQYLVEKVKDEFFVTEEQMLQMDTGEFDLEAGKAKLEEMKAKLNKIGEVNLAALEEYEKVNERHTFLSTQQVDLHQSIEDLQKTIDKINTTTKKKFSETFELINENFKKIFSRFFKGGQAELILSDTDLLETGVDIHVKPPGKKLQNLSLLSGGEKAMVAISLLFAIFIVRPNPFCLLDEVDAALDQANIVRFKEMLMEMKNNTQFILVTHSQKTMSFAERLYGITMEEKGVSKIVSVNMN